MHFLSVTPPLPKNRMKGGKGLYTAFSESCVYGIIVVLIIVDMPGVSLLYLGQETAGKVSVKFVEHNERRRDI